MREVKETVSSKGVELLNKAMQENEENLQHDTTETIAWNALVEYLMELEKAVSIPFD